VLILLRGFDLGLVGAVVGCKTIAGAETTRELSDEECREEAEKDERLVISGRSSCYDFFVVRKIGLYR
jgi:hypothetical protein